METIIKQYKGLEINIVKDEISDEDVERELHILHDNYQEDVLIEGPIQEGHDVIIDYKLYSNGVLTHDIKEQSINIGSGIHVEGLEDSLIGHYIGDEIDFKNINYFTKEEEVFHITVIEIYERENIPLDDDFAMSLNIYNVCNLNDLKEYIRNSLLKQVEEEYKSNIYNEVVNLLIENTECELPYELINEKYNKLYDYALNEIDDYGISIIDYYKNNGMNTEEIQKIIYDAAIRQIKHESALIKICELENLNNTEDAMNFVLNHIRK